MHRFQHAAMATRFEVRCTHSDAEYARQAARFAFEAVDRLELQLSRFIENSDISRINELVPGEETRVAFETMECLMLAQLAWRQTSGAFDPSIGTGFDRLDLVAGDFLVRRPRRSSPEESASEGGTSDLGPRTSDRSTGGTSDLGPRTSDKVTLDLGAIGKGYAVDRIGDLLEDWDVGEALVDAGFSSVLALEPPAGDDEWPLTLSHPDAGTVFARIGARQRVLGASGIRKGDHIRDPRTRTPVRARQAAWVSAPREVLGTMSREAGVEPSPAAFADALSTAFMIVPPQAIAEYCEAHRGVEAWILEDGVVKHFGTTET